MENASKALIIAGAILLAILIISLGIIIYRQASGVLNSNSMSEVDISTFNSKFTQFAGNNVRGAQVNSLLDQIQNNNVTYQDDTTRQVSVKVTAGTWNGTDKPDGKINGSKSYDGASTGTTYKVTYTTNSKTGLVDVITIADGGSSN